MPVAVSFTVETDGRLPTGQPLGEAIEQVDAETRAYPSYYMVNCAHPEHFENVLQSPGRPHRWVARQRVAQEPRRAQRIARGGHRQPGGARRAVRGAQAQRAAAPECHGRLLRHRSSPHRAHRRRVRALLPAAQSGQRMETLIVAIAALAGCASSVSVPDSLKPAADESLALVVPAKGDQIYECRGGKWAFLAPEAELFDRAGKKIGRHYAGPHWESLDGSRIVGAVKARADAPRRETSPGFSSRRSRWAPKGPLARSRASSASPPPVAARQSSRARRTAGACACPIRRTTTSLQPNEKARHESRGHCWNLHGHGSHGLRCDRYRRGVPSSRSPRSSAGRGRAFRRLTPVATVATGIGGILMGHFADRLPVRRVALFGALVPGLHSHRSRAAEHRGASTRCTH